MPTPAAEIQIELSPKDATKYIKLLSNVEKWDRLDEMVAQLCEAHSWSLPASHTTSLTGNLLTVSSSI